MGENDKIITPTKRKLLNSKYVTNLVPVFDVAAENSPGESDSSASPDKRRKLNRGVTLPANQIKLRKTAELIIFYCI